jgi:hypothetical protein
LNSRGAETYNIIVTPDSLVVISGESVINFMAKNSVPICATENVARRVAVIGYLHECSAALEHSAQARVTAAVAGVRVEKKLNEIRGFNSRLRIYKFEDKIR